MEQKFYICEHCGNIIAKVKDAGVPVMCCGQPMKEIVPGTVEASVEKHIPVYTVEGNIECTKTPTMKMSASIPIINESDSDKTYKVKFINYEGKEIETYMNVTSIQSLYNSGCRVVSVN